MTPTPGPPETGMMNTDNANTDANDNKHPFSHQDARGLHAAAVADPDRHQREVRRHAGRPDGPDVSADAPQAPVWENITFLLFVIIVVVIIMASSSLLTS
jgi:hypothetical protein